MPHYSPTAHVFSELDGLVIDGESRLLLYSRGRTQEEFPYSRTSLTTGEKSLIFAAWSVLDENGVFNNLSYVFAGSSPCNRYSLWI